MTSPANIDRYTAPFKAYPADLLQLQKEKRVKLPGLNTLKGQAIALMSQPELRGKFYINRENATKFFTTIKMTTRDSIQPFNKATGLKRMELGREKYCFEYPFVCDSTDILKRIGATISSDMNETINAIKDYWKKNLIDVPNKDWQIGHLDPTIADASEKNLAYQPPLQSKFRDRFKFDGLFQKMWPTAKELIPKFDQYYTEAEQRNIYDALKTKFEK